MGVVNEVLILFLLISVGALARWRGLIDVSMNRGLAELLLNVTMPLMILGAFNIAFDAAMAATALKVFLLSAFFHTVSFFLGGYLFRRYSGQARQVLRFTAVFSNCAFMGYPVLFSLYGKTGVFYGSVFTVPFIISLWTLGVYLFRSDEKKVSWGNVFLNPGLLAVLAGLVIFFLSWHLPAPVARAFDMLGATTTPLSMILIGSMLAGMPFREVIGDRKVYYAAFVRLLLVPAIALGVMYVCGVRGLAFGVCVLSLAMPVAANTAAFAEKFESDTALASRCVFVSTVFSIVTIPVFIALVNRLAGPLF